VRPGRAPERTQLAWSRTLLAGTVVAVLTVRLALHTGLTGWHAAGAACAVLGWLSLVALVRPRTRALARRPAPPARHEPALLALAILGWAVLAIALAVLP
jgi:membrane associated rhomboid family serine protease